MGSGVFAAVDGDVDDTGWHRWHLPTGASTRPHGSLHPRVFAFNAAGVLIDNDFKDYTLSCPESLGEIISDGHSLLANGTSSGVLTARCKCRSGHHSRVHHRNRSRSPCA